MAKKRQQRKQRQRDRDREPQPRPDPKVPMERWSIEPPYDSSEYLKRVAVPTRESTPD